MNSAKLDENRVRFLVMCRVPEQRLDSSAKTQWPPPTSQSPARRGRWSISMWNWEWCDTCIIRSVDGAASDVSAMLTQTDRYKEQFVSNKFQRCKITLEQWQCGIVLIKTGKRFQFVTTSQCIVAKLREWFWNRDLCAHFVTVHWRGRTWDVRRRAWLKTSGVVQQCVGRQHVESRDQDTDAERQLVAKFWRSKEKSAFALKNEFLARISRCKNRRCRVQCEGFQMSADDWRRLQASYEHRLVYDSDSIPEDSNGKNTRRESVAQTRELLKEQPRSNSWDHDQSLYFNQVNYDDHVNQEDYDNQVDHVSRSRLKEHCKTCDDSLSWVVWSRTQQSE